MSQLPPVLLFSSSDWEGLWGSRQQVALELSGRGHEVLFIERFAGLEHLYKYPEMRQRHVTRNRLVKVQDRLWRAMPPPLLPGYYHSPLVTQINANIVGRRLNGIIQNFLQGRRPILWMFKPEHHFMIGRYNEWVSVYHCIDEYTVGTSGRKTRVIQSLEAEMLRKANVVFANSMITYQNKKALAPHTHRFPSGANVAHFGKALTANPPAEIAQLQSPVLMFAGWIGDKINLKLLVKIAQEKPDWTLVLIGSTFPGHDTASMTLLNQLPNVLLPGRVDFNQLPNWFAKADVCLLPYVQGDAALYRSPLKLYEYLATGRPIISTPHPEVSLFDHLVAIYQSEDWVTAIENILKNGTEAGQEMRLSVAREHSWEKRVDGMLDAINQEVAR